jgi:ribosomal protein S18 acetylase RimI-like enzyme
VARAMTSLRRFTCNDLFTFNNVNLDALTETYNLPFYLQYLAQWPEYCTVAEGMFLSPSRPTPSAEAAGNPRTTQARGNNAWVTSSAKWRAMGSSGTAT